MANGVSRDVVNEDLTCWSTQMRALAILHGYEKIKRPAALEWARRETWLENALSEAGEASSQTPWNQYPPKKEAEKSP